MGHSSIRLKVRRKKVARLASISRAKSVNNCTIPKADPAHLKEVEVGDGLTMLVNKNIDKSGNGKWKNPKEGYPQPKNLRKKYKKKYWYKDGTIRKIVSHPSDYDKFPDRTFRPKGRAWYMEQVVQHKIAKWERKNPCPVKEDNSQQDIFEKEYLIPWKAKRESALQRFRDFVVSIYDRLELTGRFEKSEHKYEEKPVAKIKDVSNEGHSVNQLDPKKSKLLKKVQKITNKVHAKNPKLVCTNLKDHKKQKGRIILPKAAQEVW